MRKAIFAMMLTGALGAASPAGAESTKDRVSALERAVAELQASSPASAYTTQKVDRLEAEVRRLTGEVEELRHLLGQAEARLDSMSAAMAAGGPLASGEPTPLVGTGAQGTADPIAGEIARAGAAGPVAGEIASDVTIPLDPDAAYSYASDFLLSGDYGRAEAAFLLFLEAFPNHPRSADAQFRLGEIYLAATKNAEAADTFIGFIRKYPNSPRAAEAYLKLGSAFSRLNQTEEACKVFKTMKSKYPGAPATVLQRTDVEMSRIDCS